MYPVTFSGITSKVPEIDLQYLRMTRSNLMLVLSGTVLGYCSRQNTHVMYFIQILQLLLTYSLRF